MQKLTSLRLESLVSASLLKTGAILILLAGLSVNVVRAQDSFASAQVLPGDVWGSVVNDNTGVVPDTGAPSTAGFAPNAPLWYQWTAPADGVVELDTVGSSTLVTNYTLIDYDPLTGQYTLTTNVTTANLDTVLAVYTGTSISTLSQVAANDDLFPISSSNPQYNESSSGDYGGTYYYTQPYNGPSHLRFNAKGGVTYYFAEDTKISSFNGIGFASSTGPLQLSWAYKSSGVFRFATEDQDATTQLPLYQAADTESLIPSGGPDSGSTSLTYYNYNAPGVLVTVTRSAGSTGRAIINYTTVDGTELPSIPANDVPAYGEVTNVLVVTTNRLGIAVSNLVTIAPDYTPVSGTLVFDDYEMSKTILVPVNSQLGGNPLLPARGQLNKVFGIKLLTDDTNAPALDALEDGGAVSPPRVDPVFNLAMIKILSTAGDPYGPDMVDQVVTNAPVGTNDPVVVTNQVVALYPTNTVCNFEKANYRVPADVNDTNVSPWTKVTVYVVRTGTNFAATTLHYRVNNFLGSDADASEEDNNEFPLQPASDYAVPTPSDAGAIRGTNSDFDLAQGTISFPEKGSGSRSQPISFTIPTSTLTKFNKDFRIQIYEEVNNAPVLRGMINETTVTILFNDQNPPAGSVDEFYNADFNSQLAVYASQRPITDQADAQNPGVGLNGQVYALALLTNNETFIGGDFASYNGYVGPNGLGLRNVALVLTNGNRDPSFNPGSGADGAVNAVASFGGQFYIGGEFSSFNSTLVGHVARLNANGSLDTAFNPGLGADGTVRALTVLPNGEVLIGGDFTHVNGTARNYLALLNTDGTVDTAFDPADNLDGPVYALAQQNGQFLIGGNFNVSGQIFRNIARLNPDGSIDATFNPGTGANGLVRTFARMPGGQIVVGGEFTQINGVSLNHIARLNFNGSIDSGFNIGIGADGPVFNVNYATITNIVDSTTVITTNADGTTTTNIDITYSFDHYLYAGGTFSSFNGTHRYGFTRLYLDGTVDTTFMDTAYNQFAGLKRIYSYDQPGVFASAVQNNGGVLIGGAFTQVGGGQANTNVCNTLDGEEYIMPSFADPNLWVEPKARDGVRNRSGFARLIGGATAGPGNIGLNQNSYSANKSSAALAVNLVRTNGTLGPLQANFSVQPGLAQSGVDYTYNSGSPLYWIAWNYISHETRMRSDGLFGLSGFLSDPYGLLLTLNQDDALLNNQSKTTVSIINNKQTSGNLSAQFQLANPSIADTFYLGGQNIPTGAALGVSSALFTLIDDTSYPGQFGFSSPVFIATNLSPNISVVRSNGTYGVVSMFYSSSNGTAVVGTDYIGLTNKSLIFGANVTSNGFNVTVKNNGVIYTNMVEKTVNLRLFNIGTTPGATFGISNAVLRIINPNYQGYVTLGATNYSGALSSGVLNFTVNRISGSLGSVTVQYATTNGSAINGTDYVGSTNTLTWNSGDVSPRTISIPLLNPGVVGPNKQFGVKLFNPTINGAPNLALMGLIPNASLTISNDNNNGSIQFTAPSYLVNENGGYATITVVRTGGAVGPISAHYATSDGPAVDGINYMGTNGTISLASGQSSASFTVPILNDGVPNPSPANFYFNVSLIGPGTSSSAVVQIADAQTAIRPPGSPDKDFITDGMNGNVLALALQPNGQILAGGNFTAVGPVAENRLARLNADGSLDTAFLNGLSGANAAVNTVVNQTDGRILVGGAFTSIDDIHRNFIARLMTDGSLDTSFNPGSGADNTVNTVVETFVGGVRKIYVGGAFGAVNGTTSPGLVRLNNNGAVDTDFNAGFGVDGQVYAIAVYPTNSIYAGKVLIGGAFAHYNGTPINNLARLNADGSLDTNFCAGFGSGPDGAVHALAIQTGGQVLVGGSFTGINAVTVNRIARLNTDGTLDTSFVAANGGGANNVVEGIRLQPDNRIILVGQFTSANGLTRNHIAALLPTGAPDPTINFGLGANGDVDAVVIQPADGMLVIGGAFSQYDGQPHAAIARIYGGSETGSGAFTFTAGNFQVNENGIVAPITIRRTGGTSGTNADFSGDIRVNFATIGGGSAVAGVNYLSLTTNVDFPAGEVIETVYVPVLDDFVITPDLTVNLALSNPTPPATNGDQMTATLTIVNSDSSVAFSSAFYTQAKNNPTGVAVIDVLRKGGTNTAGTVDFYTTTNGTAVIGTDYYPTNATLTFNPGQSDVQVQVPIINNNIAQGNRTVTLLLSNAVNTLMAAPSNAVLTIIDTVAAPGQLYFSATNFVANEGDGNGYLTVLRTNGSSGSISVNVTVIPGTAQPGLNYGTPNGTITFGNGETTKNIAVPLVDNNVAQGPVTLSVILSAPTGGATLTDPTNATLSIQDNDSGFAFLNGTNYVRETNGIVPIFVQRVGSTNAGIHVDYTTVNGTAVAGVNYTPVSGTLTFGAGELLKTVSLPLIYDPQVTGDLRLTMKLSNPSAGTALGNPTNTVIVVQDADAGFSFTNSAISVFKNAGKAVITVVCSNPSIEPPVGDTNFTPLSVSFATADGTALAGVDYQATNGTILFTNGIGTNTISVPILNNSQVLGNHDFTVKLLNPTAPAQLVAPSVQTVTIVDNNSGLSFSSPVYKVLKTGVASTITVLRTDYTNTTSTVNFTTIDGTAVAGLDYVATNGVLTFTNGETVKTFTVPIIANTAVQPDKTVLVQLFNPVNGFLIAPYAATITIHDTTGSLVVPAGSTFAAGGDPNNNGLIDPGETVSLLFALRASGGTNIPNVYATLLVTNGITSPSPATAVSYGPMIVGGPSVSRQFSFKANGTNSQQIIAMFRLNNGVTNIGTAAFTYRLGTWTTTFYNTNGIVINDLGIASPYPSAITVTNVGGVVVKSVVTLTNLYHGYTKDIDALVVSPGGQDTMLMGHAGNASATKVTLTFDDAATNSLPASSALTTGTNKPTAYPSTTVFP